MKIHAMNCIAVWMEVTERTVYRWKAAGLLKLNCWKRAMNAMIAAAQDDLLAEVPA